MNILVLIKYFFTASDQFSAAKKQKQLHIEISYWNILSLFIADYLSFQKNLQTFIFDNELILN